MNVKKERVAIWTVRIMSFDFLLIGFLAFLFLKPEQFVALMKWLASFVQQIKSFSKDFTVNADYEGGSASDEGVFFSKDWLSQGKLPLSLFSEFNKANPVYDALLEEDGEGVDDTALVSFYDVSEFRYSFLKINSCTRPAEK